MALNCLIVDDEPLSQDVIIDYVNESPELKLIVVCNNAIEAGNHLQENLIDVLFLDINMPKLSGIGFIKSLANPPFVVLITAYPEYAIEGFEIDAVDYLLKPVSFERFRIAVNRTLQRFKEKEQNDDVQHIMVRANKKNYKLNFNDLLYLEAQGDYVRFVSCKITLIVHGTIKDFLEMLPESLFCRIHKSYVISLSKVDYIEGNMLKVEDAKLPVSVSYKNELLNKLG